jgi:hypothetical protein
MVVAAVKPRYRKGSPMVSCNLLLDVLTRPFQHSHIVPLNTDYPQPIMPITVFHGDPYRQPPYALFIPFPSSRGALADMIVITRARLAWRNHHFPTAHKPTSMRPAQTQQHSCSTRINRRDAIQQKTVVKENDVMPAP